MFDAINWIIRNWLGQDPASWAGTAWLWFLWALVIAIVIVSVGAVIAGITSWLERRIAGRMQSRIGPNRNGPGGFLQWIADAVKLLFKEDLVPKDADSKLFRAAPYFVMCGFAGVLSSLPFGPFIAADLDVGIFFVLAVTSLVVVGIIASGWSSNSKWSLFGCMRSAAQIVSYEIPAGLAILVPVMASGTLNMQELIRRQAGEPWGWNVFHSPMAFVAFFIFFISQLAEGSRTPFDLPEAESELVSGFNTEYSGFRFAIFFLEEFGNVFVIGALATTLFLGGWQIPFVSPETVMAGGFGLKFLAFLVFFAKASALLFVVIWLRWTLPRARVDQMMSLCWKYLVPAGLVCVMLSALWEMASVALPTAQTVFGVLFFVVAGLVPVVLFVRRTAANIRETGDRVDLTNW